MQKCRNMCTLESRDHKWLLGLFDPLYKPQYLAKSRYDKGGGLQEGCSTLETPLYFRKAVVLQESYFQGLVRTAHVVLASTAALKGSCEPRMLFVQVPRRSRVRARMAC